jgi:hypothetical protein
VPRFQIGTPTTQHLYRILHHYLETKQEWRPLYFESLLTLLTVEGFRQVWSRATQGRRMAFVYNSFMLVIIFLGRIFLGRSVRPT